MKVKPNPTVDRNPTQAELDRINRVEEMIHGEREIKLPPVQHQIRNIAIEHWRSLKRFLRGTRVLTTSEKAEQRWKVCQECPILVYDEVNPDTGINDGRCPECGCFMIVKTHYESAECPLKKW